MGAFSGLREAKTYEQGTFLSDGLYVVAIEKIIVKETRKSGSCLIVELRVLQSNNNAHAVGSKATWLQKLGDKDVAFGAIKLFLYAALGMDPVRDKDQIAKEVDPAIESVMDEAVEKQSLAGTKMGVQVTKKKTQKDKDFSLHVWEPFAAEMSQAV